MGGHTIGGSVAVRSTLKSDLFPLMSASGCFPSRPSKSYGYWVLCWWLPFCLARSPNRRSPRLVCDCLWPGAILHRICSGRLDPALHFGLFGGAVDFRFPDWSSLEGRIKWYLCVSPVHRLTLAGVALTMIFVALKRRLNFYARHRLLHPLHVKEVAEVLDHLENLIDAKIGPPVNRPNPENIYMGFTSMGMQISRFDLDDKTR
jgi:hypothetical protein